MKRSSNDAGFMLVELLVGISLLAVVAGLVSDSIITALRGQRDVQARASDLDGLRQAMERTTQAIRPATGVLGATPTSLALTLPNQTGGTRTLAWSVSGTNLVLDEKDTSPSFTSHTVVLSNLDAAGAIFGYAPRAGYTPATTGVVNPADCTIYASPGSYAPECIGTVTIRLRALLLGHPDLTLSDSVDLRNNT